MSNRAVRINKSNDNTLQLTTFISNLGITENVTIYQYKEHVYINSAIITSVLGIDIMQFTKRAKQPKHYIVIKKKVYVNKYGLTKLIAQSDEEVAYKLQDYIYEVMYKLETTGNVVIENVESRKDLVKELSITRADLEVYQVVDKRNQLLIQQQDDDLKNIQSDYSVLLKEYDDQTNIMNNLSDENEQLKKEINELVNISKKLAKYVRTQTKSNPVVLDNVEDSDCEYVDDTIINNNANTAKRKVNLYKKRKGQWVKINNEGNNEGNNESKSKNKGNRSNNKIEKKIYYIMRSPNCLVIDKSGKLIYHWAIHNKLPNNNSMVFTGNHKYKSFKEYSSDYRLGGIGNTEFDMIWYEDIVLTDNNYLLMSSIFDLLQNGDELLFQRIIDLFT